MCQFTGLLYAYHPTKWIFKNCIEQLRAFKGSELCQFTGLLYAYHSATAILGKRNWQLATDKKIAHQRVAGGQ
ncbi:hypothetical protein BAU15_07910 [Enterococcus sp. JM4C]|nr:hypothetical protein BAU15_07910 [Enterococcus sp. JM4C]